jgi:hypothetical protein
MSLKTELAGLALDLVKDVRREGAKLEDRVDVFKAVSAYHLGSQRAFKGKQPDDPEAPSFKDIIKRANGRAEKGHDA